MIQLQNSLVMFMERHELPTDIDMLEDDDWTLLGSYVAGVKPFVSASKLLGGENYPSACAVIPLLDQVSK